MKGEIIKTTPFEMVFIIRVKMKKLIAAALSLCMTVSLLSMAAQAASAGDAGEYAEAIELLAVHGVMVGVKEGVYAPEQNATRAQAVTMLARLAKAKAQVVDGFTDVAPGAWYAGYVGWAVENGIVVDDGSGHFQPNAPVTGSDLNQMLTRYAELTESDVKPTVSGSGVVTRGEMAQQMALFLVDVPALPEEGSVTNYSERAGGPFATAFNCYSEVSWFQSGDRCDRIYGRFYFPADFDQSKTYPTVLLAHGGGITSDIYDAYYAPALAEAGYVAFSYDVRGVDGGFGSSLSTNVNGLEPTLDTYVADANAALDFVKTKSYVDAENLFMWGQSMGAVTTQVITADRGGELRGSILLYGSVSDFNVDSFTTDKIDMQAKLDTQKESFAGDALFILGEKDIASYQVTMDNMAYYNNYSLVYISGAEHGFGYMADRPTQIATEAVLDYLNRTVNGLPQNPFDAFGKVPDQSNGTKKDSEAGYQVDFNGGYSVTVNFPSSDGKDQIFGRVYYPENFDMSKKYPTVVLAHGSGITSDIYDTYYAPALTSAGFVAFSYDVRGVEGSDFGRASNSTNNAQRTPDLITYVADANAALDYIEAQPYVDTENLFMWGQSMGAVTTQTITSQRGDELKATVLLYGAVDESNAGQLQAGMGTKDEINLMNVLNTIKADYKGETMFILGAEDDLFGYETTIGNAAYYPGGYTFVYISGANHGFGYMADRAAVQATQAVIHFLERQMVPAAQLSN